MAKRVIVAELIEVGQELILSTEHSPKNGQIGFEAVFADSDLLLPGKVRSVRFFNPFNKFPAAGNIQPGEEWKVGVTRIEFKPKSESKDGRKYVLIDVEIISRVERPMTKISTSAKGTYLVNEIMSGKAVISCTATPLAPRTRYFRNEDCSQVFRVTEFTDKKGKVAHRAIQQKYLPRDYQIMVVVATSKPQIPVDIGNLPPLCPEQGQAESGIG